MATLAEIEEHQASLQAVTTVMTADLVEFWRTLDVQDVVAVAEETRTVIPEIVAAYALASATLGADWYEQLREAAGVAGQFAALLPEAPTDEHVQRILSWDLAPMFPKEPTVQPDPDATLSRLAGSTQRLVAGADRDAITASTAADPAAPRYARHASANACAFCALLATRQDYRTERSATRVTGEVDPRDSTGFPLRGPRGAQSLGEKFHDWCRCTAVPVWPGQEHEEAPYVADWRESYLKAAEKLGRGAKTSDVLALMRDDLGLK